MSGLAILLVLAFSLVFSFTAVALVLELSHHRAWFDHHNERKIHNGNVPRLGGIGFAPVFALSAVIICLVFQKAEINMQYLPCLAALLVILAFGIYDDFRPLQARYKLLAQIAAAVLVIASGHYFKSITFFDIGLLPQPLGYALTLLWLVGITNAVNLIDGVDGLAGGVSCLIALSLVFIFYYHGSNPTLVLFCVAFFGAVLGFLAFNAPLPKAKIFMGDCGSQFLGFLLALLPLLGKQGTSAGVPVVYAAALLLIPIFDTVAAVWRRLRDRTRITEPDKAHIHHKLMNIGLSVRRIDAVLFSLQAILGVLVFVSFRLDGLPSLLVLGAAYLLATVFFAAVHFMNRAARKHPKLHLSATSEHDAKIEKFISWLTHTVPCKLPAPLIIIALWILSSQSTIPIMQGPAGVDKILHLIAYTVLAISVGLWFSKESLLKKPVRILFICIAVASVYGVIDELHQYFVAGRSCDLMDWVADTLGGITGAGVVLAVPRIFYGKKSDAIARKPDGKEFARKSALVPRRSSVSAMPRQEETISEDINVAMKAKS